MENNLAIKGLDWLIQFLEAAIMRLSILFLVAGAILGTIAILAPQFHLSSIPQYNLTWAIVQAFALDGLFVGVLFQLRDNWGRYDLPTRTWYGLIALLLGIVAALINCTLAYQEVNQTANVVDAMSQLGINQVTFSYIRSVLVVLVTALVCTLPKKHQPSEVDQVDTKVDEIVEQAVSAEVGTLRVELTEVKQMLYTIFEVQPSTNHQPELAPPSTYDRIKEYLLANPDAKNKDITTALEIPESTVKTYGAKARKELSDRITDSLPVMV